MAPRRHLPADLQAELAELIARAEERGYEIRATIANPKTKPTRGRGKPPKSEYATLAREMLWLMRQGESFTRASELVGSAAGKDPGQLRNLFRRLSAIRSLHDLAVAMFAVATKIDVITVLLGDSAGGFQRGAFVLVKSTDSVEGRAIQRSLEFQSACDKFERLQGTWDRLPQALHDLFDAHWHNLERDDWDDLMRAKYKLLIAPNVRRKIPSKKSDFSP
jgi:hypothetical protein